MMITLLLFGLVPYSPIEEHHFDVIEQSAMYDGRGELSMEFFGGLDFDGQGHRWQFWQPLKDNRPLILRDHLRGGYVVTWHDKEKKLRRVRAISFRQSWATYDVEVADREILPERQRRGLR